MLGKIIGAVAGKKVAQHVSGVDGTGGALLGVGAATLLRRLGPVGLVVAAAGGYAVKKYLDRQPSARPVYGSAEPQVLSSIRRGVFACKIRYGTGRIQHQSGRQGPCERRL